MKALFFVLLCLVFAYGAFLIGLAVFRGEWFKAVLYLAAVGFIWLRLEKEL